MDLSCKKINVVNLIGILDNYFYENMNCTQV